MHVDRGSTINLTCVAKFSPAPPPDVEWYHNDKVRESERSDTLLYSAVMCCILHKSNI